MISFAGQSSLDLKLVQLDSGLQVLVIYTLTWNTCTAGPQLIFVCVQLLQQSSTKIQHPVTISGYFVAGVTKFFSAGGKVDADHLQQALEDFCVQDRTLIATLSDPQLLKDCMQLDSSEKMPEALLGLQIDKTAACMQTLRPAVRLLTVFIHLVLQQLELAASHAVHQSATSVSKQQPSSHKLSELRIASDTSNLLAALPDTNLHVSLMALKLTAILGQATVSSDPATAVEAALLTAAAQSVALHAEYSITTPSALESRKCQADAMHVSVQSLRLVCIGGLALLVISMQKQQRLTDVAYQFLLFKPFRHMLVDGQAIVTMHSFARMHGAHACSRFLLPTFHVGEEHLAAIGKVT